MNNNNLSASAGTIARTVFLVISLANQVLIMLGLEILPFTEDEIYQVVSLGATLIAAGWAWWKNNSFTQAALKADATLAELKK